jgi:predicted ATPase
MFKNIRISHFKSVKEIELDCSRVNLFIGGPNTGKSNILEAFGLLSSIYSDDPTNFVRFTYVTDLFNDFDIYKKISVKLDENIVAFSLEKGVLCTSFHEGSEWKVIKEYQHKGGYSTSSTLKSKQVLESIKFYKFAEIKKGGTDKLDYLQPPSGDNLSSVILTRKELREEIANLLSGFGYRLTIEEPERNIKLLAEKKDMLTLIPYNLLSDTLQRMMFFLAAIHSNEKSIIILNEPESNTFPYYTKNIAEMIALDDKNNQYFISTHNPYFLLSIIEKTQVKDLSVFLTYMKEYETKIKMLQQDQLEDIMDHGTDPFFNIDRYLEE